MLYPAIDLLNQNIHILVLYTKPKTRYAQTIRFLSKELRIFISDLTQIGQIYTAYGFMVFYVLSCDDISVVIRQIYPYSADTLSREKTGIVFLQKNMF